MTLFIRCSAKALLKWAKCKKAGIGKGKGKEKARFTFTFTYLPALPASTPALTTAAG